MNIKKLVLSSYNMTSNCYVLSKNEDAVVIDPSFDDSILYNYLTNKDLNVSKIVLTHGHFDHWGGLKKLRELYPKAKTYASSLDYFWFEVGPNNPYNYKPTFDYDLNDLNSIMLLGNNYKIIKTPGHSPGSVSFYNNLNLFSGDVLFRQGIGRYDLEGGSLDILFNSIKQLYTLANETTIYCGHGNTTTIGFEKRFNPFIKG